MGWIEQARCPVLDVVKRLGWDGGRREGVPCPACGAARRDRRRLPAGLTVDGMGWRCHKCGAGGSAIDYAAMALRGARLQDLDAEDRRAVRVWFGAEAVVLSGRPPTAAAPVAVPQRPPFSELMYLWRASTPLQDALAEGSRPDPEFERFLVRRNLARWVGHIDGGDLARAAPGPGEVVWPAWWPRGRAQHWRLLVRAFEPSGVFASLHARAIRDVTTSSGDSLPKTFWPKSSDSVPLSARGLLFSDPRGLALMRGATNRVEQVVLCEGLTDWLAAAAWSAAAGREDLAVLGAASGGFPALAHVAWPDRVAFVALVDEDKAGDAYFEEIRQALRGRTIRRAELGVAS